MAARLQFRYWKDKVLNNLLSLRWRLSRNKNAGVGEWHFQAARGRRNCFFGATGHSSRRSGWMARDEINTSGSGPILSFKSTGFDPWNWKSSPPKWTAQAESSLFPATFGFDERSDRETNQKNKKDVFFRTSSCFLHTTYSSIREETSFLFTLSLTVLGLSFTRSCAASSYEGYIYLGETQMESNDTRKVLKLPHWHPKVRSEPVVV